MFGCSDDYHWMGRTVKAGMPITSADSMTGWEPIVVKPLIILRQIKTVETERDALLRPSEEGTPAPGAMLKTLKEIGAEFVGVLWLEGLFRSFSNRRCTRKSLGLIREDADMRALLFKLMHETTAVGRAAGVDLPEDFAMELDRSIAAFPPTMKASMANDLEAGRPLELDWLAGKVVALGRKYGVPTPAQEAVYAILKPYRTGLIR